jgi:hypothetical protein
VANDLILVPLRRHLRTVLREITNYSTSRLFVRALEIHIRDVTLGPVALSHIISVEDGLGEDEGDDSYDKANRARSNLQKERWFLGGRLGPLTLMLDHRHQGKENGGSGRTLPAKKNPTIPTIPARALAAAAAVIMCSLEPSYIRLT